VLIVTISKPSQDLTQPTSHRPIALLSSLWKIYERVLLKILTTTVGLKIREEQHTFRHEHLTVHQVVHIADHLRMNEIEKKKTASAFLDVEKAFDKMWHNGLNYKLITFVTPPGITKTISSFLKNRTF